jgi:flagella basal body P-ring formation protein FlgA
MSPKRTVPTCHFAPWAPPGRGNIRDVKDRPSPSFLPALPAGSCTPVRVVAVAGLALVSGLAGAQVPAALPAADVARALALVQQAAERLAPPEASVTASLGKVDPRLKPAPCVRAEPFVPRGVPPWGSTRVGLRCTQGPVAWTLYLPVQVQVRAPALGLKTALPAGAVIGQADLVTAPVDWSAHPLPPLTDPAAAIGRTLGRAVAAGAALLPADLKARRWFAAGDRVKVVSGGPGFAIAAEGLALTDGQDGQRVRVQMLLRGDEGQPERGPVVQGVAVAERQVELPL